jgi:hypothetical protein
VGSTGPLNQKNFSPSGPRHTTHRSDGWVWARPVSEINATANIVRFLRMFFAAENIGTKNSRLY